MAGAQDGGMNEPLSASTLAAVSHLGHHRHLVPPAALARLALLVLFVFAALVALPSLAAASPAADAGAAPAAATADAAPAAAAAAPPASPSRYTLRPSVMAGVMQWTLFGGGNLAGQVKYRRVVFEYSHGQALHYDRLGGFAQTAAERDAGVEVESPWTTGGGVGYQITPNLHLMIELKAHHYLVRDTTGDSIEYTTFTAGPGLFYDWYVTKNFFVQPNVRWWPTLASTYDRDSATLMAEDGSAYQHARHDLIPFVNVNLGWTFDGR
jgi:hypothetical protein